MPVDPDETLADPSPPKLNMAHPDTALELPWQRQRLRVPREDQTLFAVPSLRDAADVMVKNHAELKHARTNIQGRTLSHMRRWTRNAAVKAHIVTEDERETTGLRSLLNYGHTIGHGLEAAAGYDRYLHGEAVAIGMTGAAQLGLLQGVTSPELVERQAALLARFGLPSSYSGVDADAILAAMGRDKKVVAGDVSWVLLEDIGRSSLHRGVPREQVERVVTELSE